MYGFLIRVKMLIISKACEKSIAMSLVRRGVSSD